MYYYYFSKVGSFLSLITFKWIVEAVTICSVPPARICTICNITENGAHQLFYSLREIQYITLR